MHTLPGAMLQLLRPFAPLFDKRVWAHARVLIAGALLCGGARTVSSCLRAVGSGQLRRFERYHRVLSRDSWSGPAVGRVLLGLLVVAFTPAGPVVVGVDERLERRRGAKIAARDIFRDAARSSREHLALSSGLRWVSMMVLVPVPFAGRVWALPFLTALAPSRRYYERKGRAHSTVTDRARQMARCARRWLPGRSPVLVGDSIYAAIPLLAACRGMGVAVVTRLRLDAALYEPAPPRVPGKPGRPRKKGERLPRLREAIGSAGTRWRGVVAPRWYGGGECRVEVATGTAVWHNPSRGRVPLRRVLVRDPAGGFEPQALLCTDLDAEPEQVAGWYALRWGLEVTFEEARRHLGVETQRQWSEKAVARTTPAILGLYSLVALWAHRHQDELSARQAAWYHKDLPTFSDALALARRRLWQGGGFRASGPDAELVLLPRPLVECLTDALCYAA